MNVQAKIRVTLQSDAVFGSGYSIPGGEDIAVKTDDKGYPYLSGTTFRGLLREELANWLEWEETPEPEAVVAALFGGEDDWFGRLSHRRVSVSSFHLSAFPPDSGDCFAQRVFTAIDCGTVKEGTLRLAACIRRGLVFQGTVDCAEEDATLLENALRCIKWIGTGRSRGFGQVDVRVVEWVQAPQAAVPLPSGNGPCLRYALTLREPVRITDISSSHDTYQETRNYIPASTIRGAVLNGIAQADPIWFERNKRTLMKKIRFTNAVLNGKESLPAIPTPKGFYEDKLGRVFYHFLLEKDVKPETKRAALGRFSVLDSPRGQIRSWTPKQGEDTRLNLAMQRLGGEHPGGMFRSGWLAEGQRAEGMIILENPGDGEQVQKILSALGASIRLGAGRHTGFGLCDVELLGQTSRPVEGAAYGYQAGDEIPSDLFMLLLSPLGLQDPYGEPCGLSKEMLTELLGVPVTDLLCATSTTEIHGFNRTYGARLPARVMYDSGCTFRITCEEPPDWQRLLSLELKGIGIRREEGFGRVLFLKGFHRIKERPKESGRGTSGREGAQNRRQRAKWLMEQVDQKCIPEGLSKSQIGTLQGKLQELRYRPQSAREELLDWFARGTEKEPRTARNYKKMQGYIETVLDDAGVPAQGISQRFQLLADLFDLARKEGP